MTATDPRRAQLLEAATSSESPGPKSFAAVELTMRTGEMTPLHVHDEDETYRVLEGSIVIHAGDENVFLEAGEAFVAPAGVPHTHRADSGIARYVTTTRVRSVHRYEDFLRAVALPGDGAPGTDAPAEDEAVAAWFARENGIEVLGPPGALPST